MKLNRNLNYVASVYEYHCNFNLGLKRSLMIIELGFYTNKYLIFTVDFIIAVDFNNIASILLLGHLGQGIFSLILFGWAHNLERLTSVGSFLILFTTRWYDPGRCCDQSRVDLASFGLSVLLWARRWDYTLLVCRNWWLDGNGFIFCLRWYQWLFLTPFYLLPVDQRKQRWVKVTLGFRCSWKINFIFLRRSIQYTSSRPTFDGLQDMKRQVSDSSIPILITGPLLIWVRRHWRQDTSTFQVHPGVHVWAGKARAEYHLQSDVSHVTYVHRVPGGSIIEILNDLLAHEVSHWNGNRWTDPSIPGPSAWPNQDSNEGRKAPAPDPWIGVAGSHVREKLFRIQSTLNTACSVRVSPAPSGLPTFESHTGTDFLWLCINSP